MNLIKISGGGSDWYDINDENERNPYMWAADEAYIMDENGEDFDKEDIGIIIISKFEERFFFNSDDLKSTAKLYRAPL